MPIFFKKNQKTLFLADYHYFGGQKNFPKKSGMHDLIRFLVPCWKSEKPNDQIPRKQPNRQQDGRTSRPYFMEPFRLL